MSTVYVNIGTNLGDRYSNLSRALAGVAAGYRLLAVSSTVESEPWGFASEHGFLNLCAAFDSGASSPLEVLDAMQEVERSISPASHRNPDGSYADRIIDIDIVHIEGIEMHSPRLTLPHPHLHDRDFFLLPFREVSEKIHGD